MSEPIIVSAEPYGSNREHLNHRFARADQLLKAQTVRWRSTLANTKPADHWGMVLVGDAEIRSYLESPFSLPDELPRDLEAKLTPFWRHAQALGREIEARRRATPAGVNLRFERLRRVFDLDGFDIDLISVLLLIETDGRLRRLVGYLQDDATRRLPSVDLLAQILQPTTTEESASLSIHERMSSGALIENELVIVDGTDDPLADRSVRLDDRIAAFLVANGLRANGLRANGLRANGRLDDSVPTAVGALASATSAAHFKLPAPAEGLVDIDIRRLGENLSTDQGVVLIVGPYGSGRRDTAFRLAEAADRPILFADVSEALTQPEGWTKSLAHTVREARLAESLLVWTGCEALLQRTDKPEETSLGPLWDQLLSSSERAGEPAVLISTVGWEPTGTLRDRPYIRLDLAAPSFQERRRLWHLMLPDNARLRGIETESDRQHLIEELANGFQLSGGQIADALVCADGEAQRRGDYDGRLSIPNLLAGCRRQSGQVLNRFARRIEPRPELGFDQLVLPATNRRQLEDLRLRIQHRSQVLSDLGFESRLPLGKGLLALFSGGSGTGKTLAAELLAGEQGVDLYKVDLSAVVSKYVGETEKNLDRVFAEAECSNALLFFDEADALFGKRGEVKEARDRWANLEINFLLQRIEEYPGVIILTTNLRQNIDQAFMRRIQVLVEFPFPDTHARLAIWQGMFPDALEPPAGEVLQRFAEQYELPGGSIKNVVIDAAHRALAEETGRQVDSDDLPSTSRRRPTITERHLALALAREYQKLGKPITRTEFSRHYRFFENELA